MIKVNRAEVIKRLKEDILKFQSGEIEVLPRNEDYSKEFGINEHILQSCIKSGLNEEEKAIRKKSKGIRFSQGAHSWFGNLPEEEKQRQTDIITEKAIQRILLMTAEDWKGTIKEMGKEKIRFHIEDFIEEEKRYNLSSFLEGLNKEQIEIFIHLILKETRRFLDIIDLEELKKLKLD